MEEEVKEIENKIDKVESVKPIIGMLFENLTETWEFRKRYGESTGFGVRKNYQNRRKKRWCLY